MGKLKEKFVEVKEKIKNLYSKSEQERVIYMNKPITEEVADEIGMNVYVDYLEGAIKKGADMIAVISSFGTGKSSLIQLLKTKYASKRAKLGQYKRVYCEINLWSLLETNKAEQTLELHRTFLYQLIASICPEKSGYFSRRTSQNFGMFKISGESRFWSICTTVLALILAILVFVDAFEEKIVECGILSEKTTNYLFIGYVICVIIAIVLFVNTEIVFSSRNSEGKRKIEENELMELYRRHILHKSNILQRLNSLKIGAKQIVIVIEDLDRVEKGDGVYQFLKELRKYYIPNVQSEQKYVNKVTFIINIMPEDILHQKCSERNSSDYVYDKLFDYSLMLNRINIDNFDAILEALIMEKREMLTSIGISVTEANNVHNIKGIQWLIHGKDLTLRKVKERLNDAIVLYESLREKFDKDHAEFHKCVVVAYLRSAYSKEFYKLSDGELDEMLNWYAKSNRSESEFIERYDDEENGRIEFLGDIYKMIKAHLIDGNYRSYFFNYPKNSHLYTAQEMHVRNIIIYDEKLAEKDESDIKVVGDKQPEVIIDALKKVKELLGGLPEVVLWSNKLWEVANREFHQNLGELLITKFTNVELLKDEEYALIDGLTGKTDGMQMFCMAILENEPSIIFDVRNYLLDKHIGIIAEYLELFSTVELPLSEGEFSKMKHVPLEYILEMVKGTIALMEDAVAKRICKRIVSERNPHFLIQAESFYEELVAAKSIESYVEEFINYMIVRQCILPSGENVIYEAVEEGQISIDKYYYLLKNIAPEALSVNVLNHISMLKQPGDLGLGVCQKLKENELYTAYLLNMITLYADNIELPFEEVKKSLVLDGEELWMRQPELFFKIRRWACKNFKDEVVKMEGCFKLPFPLITCEETEYLSKANSIFSLYDIEQSEDDQDFVYVKFCNRQFRKGEILYKMFMFLSSMDNASIPKMFYSLDMRNVRFSAMAVERKRQVLEKLRGPLNLKSSLEIVRFMKFTEYIMTELLEEIMPELKVQSNSELHNAYIEAVQASGRVTEKVLRSICAMPVGYAYGDLINDALYKADYYYRYIHSKMKEKDEFVFEKDKIDTLWNDCLKILNNPSNYVYTCPILCKSLQFLRYVREREGYKGLPEKIRMELAKVLQDRRMLVDALEYGDAFAMNYLSKIAGFTDDVAAEEFVLIMSRNSLLASSKKIYINVHPKLSGVRKRRYTNLYRRSGN